MSAEVAAMGMDIEKVALLDAMMLAYNPALTFDDVRLRTRHGHGVRPPETEDLTCNFSKNVEMQIPFVSAAMDTVTESAMATTMAQAGGIGVIHGNLTPKDQMREVRRVKLFMNGRIENPVTVNETDTVESVLAMCDRRRFDFRTFPVVNSERRFVGLMTQSDFDFCREVGRTVGEAMTPREDVHIQRGRVTIKKAYEEMQAHKKKTLPILDPNDRVKRMFLYSDVDRIMNKSENYNVDKKGQLRVAAAVPTRVPEALERIGLMRKYLDVVVIDSADGDSFYSFETLEAIKSEYPDLDVVVGNVSEGDSARELAAAGADGIKVGQGPGSICTTRRETGIGMPQVTAVYECARAVEKYGIPICADGGIRYHGDTAIAIAAGGNTVMMGNMLSATDQAPGEIIVNQDGSRVMVYRGMGSEEAIDSKEGQGSRDRYGNGGKGPILAEGVLAYQPYKGDVEFVVNLCTLALRKSMRYLKRYDLDSLRSSALMRPITNAGLTESHPHVTGKK
jgi:IMP dehydrogenase